jgi:hypothetical protein
MRQYVTQLWSSSQPTRRKLWLRWNNPEQRSSPVFLVGCGRSGTNMIGKRLARSWQIDIYNEDHPAAFDDYYLKDFSTLEHLIQCSAANLVLFKPIRDTYQINRLLSHFPDAKSIFVIRHYSDVINSGMKRFGADHWLEQVQTWLATDFAEFSIAPPKAETKDFVRSRYTPAITPESGAAVFWWFRNQLFFDLECHTNEHIRLVQYERIVSNPDQEMAELCRFLGIRFHADATDGIRPTSVRRDSQPVLDEQIEQDCQNLWERLMDCLPANNSHLEG